MRERIIRDVHRIRAHVGNQCDGAFAAQLDAFIKPLRERHSALRRVSQPVVSGLLELRRRERWRRIALLFLLRDARDLPFGFRDGGDDLVRGFLISNRDFFALVAAELGFKNRRLARIEHGVNRPVLDRHKRANLLLALDDQAQRNGLHAPGG